MAARITIAAWIVIICGYFLTGTAAHAGLYDDESKNVTSGDLKDQDYWWTKYDMMMLDMALKQHQPEGRIGFDLVSTKQRLDALTQKYPKHEELKKWKAHVEDIQSKIDPNASRSEYFNSNMPWEESNFAQLWVNFHYAQTLIAAGDFNTAYSMLLNVMQNYQIMLAPDRMKDYPEELRKWVIDNKPVADKMLAEAKEKTGQ